MDGASVTQSLVVSPGVPLTWRIVKVVDGDRRADLVWRRDTQQLSSEPVLGEVAVWLMHGATPIEAPVVSSGGPLTWQIQWRVLDRALMRNRAEMTET